MAPIPRVEDFVNFSEVDPSSQKTCIWHLPAKGRRCSLGLTPEDCSDAATLKRKIVQSINTGVSLASLQTYVLLNCCRQWHHARLEEFGIVEPLARRWQEEIERRQILPITSSQHRATSGPSRSLPTPQSSTPPQDESPALPRYSLRPRRANEVQRSTPSAPTHDLHRPEFRPHKVYPPQTVSSVLLRNLEPSDKKPGSIYLFTRTTSPGFVKIGYTSRPVQTRLHEWQRDCGYVPELVSSLSAVPNVKRVETLIHFELYGQWRKEVWCSRCARQHMEWFEIATDKAVGIAKQWTRWMMDAKPYGSNGVLSKFWRIEVQRLEACGKAVTAGVLLDIYHADSKRTSSDAGDITVWRGISTASCDATVANPVAASGLAQVGETAAPNAQRLPTEARLQPTATDNATNSRHIKAIADTIQALTKQQQDDLTFELVRRSSTLDGDAVTRISTCTPIPGRLERHNTNPTLTACA